MGNEAVLVEQFLAFPADGTSRGGDEFGMFGISVLCSLTIDF
jgi:hypothetical protein